MVIYGFPTCECSSICNWLSCICHIVTDRSKMRWTDAFLVCG